jgi:hypothetical protein
MSDYQMPTPVDSLIIINVCIYLCSAAFATLTRIIRRHCLVVNRNKCTTLWNKSISKGIVCYLVCQYSLQPTISYQCDCILGSNKNLFVWGAHRRVRMTTLLSLMKVFKPIRGISVSILYISGLKLCGDSSYLKLIYVPIEYWNYNYVSMHWLHIACTFCIWRWEYCSHNNIQIQIQIWYGHRIKICGVSGFSDSNTCGG